MGLAKVKFESLDDPTRREAEQVAQAVQSARGGNVTLRLHGRLAEIIGHITALMARDGGLAYGGLASELTPEQAAKILGVSRPLVVRRMEDGRLPFRYEGAHRRCRLEDVLRLKAREESQTAAMRELAEMDDVDLQPIRRP